MFDADEDLPPTLDNPFYHTYRIEPGIKKGKEKALPKAAEGEEEGSKPKHERKPKYHRRGGYSLRRGFSATTSDPEYQYQVRLDRFKQKMMSKTKGDLTALGLRHPVLNMTKAGIRNK